MNEKKTNPGLVWGAVTGIVLILAHLGFYLAGNNGQFGFAYTLVSILIVVLGCTLAVLQQRRNLGGYADTKQLLTPAAATMVIGVALYVAYSYLYYHVIDTGAAAKEKQYTLETYLKMIPMTQASPAEIAQGRKDIEQLDFNLTPGQALWKLANYIIRYFILVFLVAFIFRRKAPATPNH